MLTNKKHSVVRLIALGPSCAEATWSCNYADTWGIQYTWRNFKLDNAFVLDDEEWIKAKNHSFTVPIDIAREMRDAKIPIYVAKKWSDVENTVEYPIKEALEYFKPINYFMNSMAYMFALAIMEGYERIETYGIDFRYFGDLGNELKFPSNWLDETHCGAFWVGLAIGRGIEVVTTKRSSLMKPVKPNDPNLYGYSVSEEIQKQRQGILANRKKVELKQINETLQVFRPPKGIKGDELKEFMRQVELGNVKSIGNVEAKLVDDNTPMEGEIKAVGDRTVTLRDRS